MVPSNVSPRDPSIGQEENMEQVREGERGPHSHTLAQDAYVQILKHACAFALE